MDKPIPHHDRSIWKKNWIPKKKKKQSHQNSQSNIKIKYKIKSKANGASPSEHI